MTKASVMQQLATESTETIRTPAPRAFHPALTRVLTAAPPAPMNEVQVPLLSPHLRDQIFPPRSSPSSPPAPTQAAVSISVAHLRSHGLLAEPSAVPVPGGKHKKAPEDAIDFVLPALQGETIIDHFKSISAETAEPYLSLAQSFATFELPPMPDKGTWLLSSGWTHYSIDGAVEQIDYPSEAEEVMVFDVETLPYVGGHYPVMAVAVGREGWYGWCSPWLVGDSDSPNHLIPFDSPPPADLAPLSLFEQPQQSPRLLIGHNVLFDRARVSSEYTLRRPSSRWLDTQSLHVAVSGLTSPQRPAWMMHRKNLLLQAQKDAQAPLVAVEAPLDADEEEGPPVELPPPSKEKDKGKEKVTTKEKSWQEVSSMNSLAEVAKLHCKITVDKSMRNVFIDHSTGILDVRNNFDELMHYCATDVLTAQSVYQVLLPRFLQKCAHPASFAGILIMSQPILPVDTKWPLYLSRAETMYIARLKGCKDALHVLAEEARAKMSVIDPATGKFVWETDLWLRQMDWTPKKARRLPDVVPQLKRKLLKKQSEGNRSLPTWFSSLKKDDDGQLVIPLQSSTAAALLRCTYRSFPTYFSTTKGWIFAAPKRKSITLTAKELPVEMEELGPKDERIQALRGVKFFTIPAGRAGTKRNKLLVAKDVESGVVASDFPEMKVGIDPTTDVDSEAYRQVQQTLSRLAHEAVEGMSTIAGPKGAKDLWLRQLDWSLVDVLYADQYEQSIPNLVPPKETDLVWPTWYHDLDKPGLGLDVSIGKRVAPLLLRLRWKGHPLVYSKEHGWTYRIPDLLAADTLAADPSLVPVLFHDIADANLADDRTGVFVKLPHTDGEEKNVGNPLSKAFVSAFENDVLSSEFPAAKAALELNASCSYWAMARERIMNQMVVWDGQASIAEPTPDAIERGTSDPKTRGIILPQVTPMGTVTRRAVERTWLTASNAKKNRVGSELKSMVVAPPGYSIVGADVDSEELWICSVMGDAQFGIHGATAIGWMTLEGTKSAGTDLHSKTASILGISRDDAKVFNYSRIYGAGVKHAVSLLIKANPALTKDAATALAKNLYASTKGLTSRVSFNRDFWHGGTESFVFNKLEEIAQSDEPLTPALGCGITDALTKVYLPKTGRDTYLPSRINWVVQSSGVDYLHLLLVSMEYLTRKFDIDARYMISVHDEVRYLVREEDRYRAAMALQISNLWTRALFSHRLQIADLPQVRPPPFVLFPKLTKEKVVRVL